MKYGVFILFALICMTNCSDDERPAEKISWKKLGLGGLVVNEMVIHDNVLFAATDKGLYRKDINGNDDFVRIGFENLNIEDVIVFSLQEIMATYVDRTYGADPVLYVTENGGVHWDEIDTNFGGEIREPIFDLEVHPEDENVLYGTGRGVVAKSTDRGVTWAPIWGDWQMLASGVSIVAFSPDGQYLWAGGQGAIENGFLLQTSDEEEWNSWYDLVHNPTVVKEIVFDGDQNMYVGFEGALLKSGNNGSDWETLIDSDETRFFFGIGVSARNRNHLYAAGWLKTDGHQPLKLFISQDAGANWQIVSFDEEDFGGVWDLAITSSGNEDRIFLGLAKGGVYEVRVAK